MRLDNGWPPPDSLVVTLSGATCPAEKHFARDREGRDLLGEFYAKLFDAIKPLLEARMQEILGRQVQRSRVNVDPESGTGAILLTLASEACLEEQ